jgi:hypothetical protein
VGAPPLARLAATAATHAIRTGMVRNAQVIGAELISPFMDQADRNVAVLIGDGAAVTRWQFEARKCSNAPCGAGRIHADSCWTEAGRCGPGGAAATPF